MRRLPFAVLLLLAGCQSDRPLSVLGYAAGPPYDPAIRTVYVPVFKNGVVQTSPYRGVELDLTQAVVREIGSRSNMRIVSDPERADTELIGTLMNIEKRLQNRNQQNHVREAEIVLTATVVWRDLRTGRMLSNPRPREKVGGPPPTFDPTLPPPPDEPVAENPSPQQVVAVGRLLPEVGETTATATQMAVDQMAKQIVQMMEKPW